jgi:hypothetical protein
VSGPDPLRLALATACLDRVMLDRDAELVVTCDRQTGRHHARLILYGARRGSTETVRRGSGALLPEALCELWDGPLGLRRWLDPEGWRADRPAA